MKISIFPIVSIPCILLLLTSCTNSLITAQQCQENNWHRLSLNDGIADTESHDLAQYIKSCKEYDINNKLALTDRRIADSQSRLVNLDDDIADIEYDLLWDSVDELLCAFDRNPKDCKKDIGYDSIDNARKDREAYHLRQRRIGEQYKIAELKNKKLIYESELRALELTEHHS